MTYPGGKNGAGVKERIISLMPPHEVYIEPFLGAAAVMKAKRPALVNIGLDLDPRSPGLAWLATLVEKGEGHTPLRKSAHSSERCECGCAYPDHWPSTLARSGAAAGEIVTSGDERRRPSPDPALKASTSTSSISGDATRLVSSLAGPAGTRASSDMARGSTDDPDDSPDSASVDRSSPDPARSAAITWRGEAADGVEFLRAYPFTGRELVYCDPPYLMSTRSGKRLYQFEWWVDQHRQILDLLKGLPCLVMVSGYESSLYTEMLQGWNSIQYEAMTRGGHTATEWLWYNYPTPVELHDYQYLGEGFRERERIKRLKGRWTARLRSMPQLQRQALLAAIADIGRDGEGGSTKILSRLPVLSIPLHPDPSAAEVESSSPGPTCKIDDADRHVVSGDVSSSIILPEERAAGTASDD